MRYAFTFCMPMLRLEHLDRLYTEIRLFREALPAVAEALSVEIVSTKEHAYSFEGLAGYNGCWTRWWVHVWFESEHKIDQDDFVAGMSLHKVSLISNCSSYIAHTRAGRGLLPLEL